jgi:uncharacterized membrane protein
MTADSSTSVVRHRVERLTAGALRTCVWLSSLLMIGGLMWAWFEPTHAVSPSAHDQLSAFLFLQPLNALTLLSIGTVLLILTPFLRVALAILGFILEHDRTFTLISLSVFLMLIAELAYAFWQ